MRYWWGHSRISEDDTANAAKSVDSYFDDHDGDLLIVSGRQMKSKRQCSVIKSNLVEAGDVSAARSGNV
jgi:hypothetical protein